MGLMSWLSTLAKILAVVMLFIGVTTAYLELTDESKDEIISNLSANPLKGGALGSCFLVSYNYVTASYQYEWLGNPDTKIFMLEDIPLPDSFDVIPIGIIIMIVFVFLKYTLFAQPRSIKTYVIAGISMIASIFVLWVFIKTIMYFLMMGCGDGIGLTKDMIDLARSAVANKYSEFNLFYSSLLITAFSSTAIAYAMFGKKND